MNEARAERRWLVGVDIGGTFTDLLLFNPATGRHRAEKVLTVSEAPEEGVLRAIKAALAPEGVSPAEVPLVVHGTTLVANTLLQRAGAPTALVTTAGFGDILEIRNEQRYDVYDLFSTFPEPLIPVAWRFEVAERVLSDRTVLRALDPGEARALVERIAGTEAKAVAICLLHAYANPAHEQQLKAVFETVAPHVLVTLSSNIAPMAGEYERMSTTAANAYVQPRVHEYLRRLETGLGAAGVRSPLYMMLSDGGTTPVAPAAAYPIRLVESGPAAGVIAAEELSRMLGQGSVVAFDMGGTTAKIAVLTEGRALRSWDLEVCRTHRFKKGSGLPLLVPSVELVEIGAGGGSIAHIDRLGLLRVGPESAEAFPGPACYGRGGTRPTVTDAAVVLGYLNPEFFLGGRMRLDRDRAAAAIQEHVAGPMNWPVRQAALGIIRIATAQMAEAMRVHLSERGLDPRRFTLIAFGGAGPLHAADVAATVGLSRAVIPPMAGIMSALGLLQAPLSFSLSHALNQPLSALPWEATAEMFDRLSRQLVQTLPLVRDGPAETAYALDMKYDGQKRTLEVPVEREWVEAHGAASIRAQFERIYEVFHGRVNPNLVVQVANLKVRATLHQGLRGWVSHTPVARDPRRGARPVLFDGMSEPMACPVFDRYALRAGTELVGPAILEENETTILVRPGDRAEVDRHGNLIIYPHAGGQR
ncbi:MAG: hydantoinase/oxoprolinase family protein [Armatimonadetes bacterium]|nr:hydantoinase/oxoprolinase family protein [Armatimonadota bacterium]